MKSTCQTCIPRQTVPDDRASIVANPEEILKPDEAETGEFRRPIFWQTPHYEWAFESWRHIYSS